MIVDKTKIFADNIQKWLESNSAAKQKINKQICGILWTIYENNISLYDLKTIISHINLNEFTLSEGNLWNNLSNYFDNEEYVPFFKSIFNLTPCGLSTSPNAACGKGELFYRLLRPHSSMPNKGDIQDKSKIKN